MTNTNIDASQPQPDPSWDYYVLYHSLHHIKAKIDAALKLMTDTEDANAEVDGNIHDLLDLASDKLIDVLHALKPDDD